MTRTAPRPPKLGPARINRLTVQQQIYDALEEKIIGGEFAPGDSISVGEVSAIFGVSPMPAREALLRLAAEGAVEVSPKKAARIPTLSARTFRELTRMRVELEGLAAELAAQAEIGELLDVLRDLDSRLQRAADSGNVRRYLQLNREFHFAIYERPGTPLLLGTIRRLWLLAGPTLRLYAKPGIRLAPETHSSICDALARGDSSAARAALAWDIQSGADYILRGPLGET